MTQSLFISIIFYSCLLDQAQYDQRHGELFDDDNDGFTEDEGDCNDANPFVFPGAEEICNTEDDDCDGFIDDEPVDGGPWYFDEDGDGYGDGEYILYLCESPGEGWLLNGGDCDDTEQAISPAALEVCNKLKQLMFLLK